MRKISGILGVSLVAVLAIASASQATFTAPGSLIFSASFDSGSANADLSLNGGNTAIRATSDNGEGSGDLSWAYNYTATGGLYSGGISKPWDDKWGSGRVRWETPTAVSSATGMVEMWVKIDSTGSRAIDLFDFGTGRLRLATDNSLKFSVYGQGDYNNSTSYASLSDGNWHHVAVTWANSGDYIGKRIWVDGQCVGWAPGATGSFTPSYIGMGSIYANADSISYDELHVYSGTEIVNGGPIGYQGQMVPEPMTIGLVLAGVAGLLRRRVA